MDKFLRRLVRRIDALEEARSGLASKVEALQHDNESLKRETDRTTDRLKQQIDGLIWENVILREEIASLKYGKPTVEKSRKRSKTEHLALTTLGNDTNVLIAFFLGAKGVACLGQTCRHFGKVCVGTDGQLTSLVEKLAGQVVDGSATDYEKSVLKGGGKVKMLLELELMRSPSYFKQLNGCADMIKYSQPEDKSTITLRPHGEHNGQYHHVTAISNQEMRAGRHYVTFHVTGVHGSEIYLDFGVIRPIKDCSKKGLDNFVPLCYEKDQHIYRKLLLAEKTDEWGDNLHFCSYHSEEGACFFANWNDEDRDEDEDEHWPGDEWEGREPAPVVNNLAVGLLLDLDAGTLSVFKDGRKLGVMKEGLTGAYCWFVFQYAGHFRSKCSINVKRGMPPGNA